MLKLLKLIVLFLSMIPVACFSLTFHLPDAGNSVVGEIHEITVQSNDDITAISEQNDVGPFEIAEANPGKNIEKLYISENFIVPSQFILPSAPRKGIVINVAELRLYYYLKDGKTVMTFPVGIGRKGEETPLLTTKIIEKKIKPNWYPAQSTRLEAKEQGIVLPQFVEPGPDNPLGSYAMRLGLPDYLIHGTEDPTGVGIRSSAGCIRMYEEDVKTLFELVAIGTPVRIIDEPYKVGFDGDKLELESHVPLDHQQNEPMTSDRIQELNVVLMPYVTKYHVQIDWDAALAIAQAETGIPEVVGMKIGAESQAKRSSLIPPPLRFDAAASHESGEQAAGNERERVILRFVQLGAKSEHNTSPHHSRGQARASSSRIMKSGAKNEHNTSSRQSRGRVRASSSGIMQSGAKNEHNTSSHHSRGQARANSSGLVAAK